MRKPVYANHSHEVLINIYIQMCKDFAKDLGTHTRYANYLDVLDIILEYHNTYGEKKSQRNYYDWLMIIPTNLSVMTNGYFAGIETSTNRGIIKAYKIVLEEVLHKTIDKIETFKTYD